MSLKDDFKEAWNSVKRDFFAPGDESGASSNTQEGSIKNPSSSTADQSEFVSSSFERGAGASDPLDEDSVAYDRIISQQEYLSSAEESIDDGIPPLENTPFRLKDDSSNIRLDDTDRRSILDPLTGNGSMYSDDKTIISKNTIIRGALQTDDSVRLLGQVLGDIDCKSNIVVAGKVRGNTSAANAYIFDAQVDGDVRCEDVINISDDAWILGNIRAQQAEIDGKIKGNIEIRHIVSIGANSSVLGDISADELEIKRGAFINGQIMMYSPSRDVLDRFDRFGDK